MTLLDYVVIGIVALSTLLGLWRGVISEVLALLAWVAAFMAARLWAQPAGEQFAGLVSEPALRYAAGFATVLIGVLVVFALFRFVLSLLIKAAGLGTADRLLGAGFGFLRGMLIVLVGVLLAGLTGLPKTQAWRHGWTAPQLESAAAVMKSWLPADVAKRIQYR